MEISKLEKVVREMTHSKIAKRCLIGFPDFNEQGIEFLERLMVSRLTSFVRLMMSKYPTHEVVKTHRLINGPGSDWMRTPNKEKLQIFRETFYWTIDLVSWDVYKKGLKIRALDSLKDAVAGLMFIHSLYPLESVQRERLEHLWYVLGRFQKVLPGDDRDKQEFYHLVRGIVESKERVTPLTY